MLARVRQTDRPTGAVSPQPLVEDGVGVGVEQDEDGVVGGEVGLAAGAVQEQMGQVVQAADGGVVVPLGGAVACGRSRERTRLEHGALSQSWRLLCVGVCVYACVCADASIHDNSV